MKNSLTAEKLREWAYDLERGKITEKQVLDEMIGYYPAPEKFVDQYVPIKIEPLTITPSSSEWVYVSDCTTANTATWAYSWGSNCGS